MKKGYTKTATTTNRFDIYQTITDKLVAIIEKAESEGKNLPWHKPYLYAGMTDNPIPRNTANRAYRGVNFVILKMSAHAEGFTSNVWSSFKNWQALGANVKKGEQATMICFWKELHIKDSSLSSEDRADGMASSHDRKIPFLRYYNVFNLDQVEGVDRGLWENPPKPLPDFGVRDFSSPLDRTSVKVSHSEQNRAYYRPSSDEVSLPNREQFLNRDKYLSTLAHELSHATGHSSRLNRGLDLSFGKVDYAKEELVADLGACMTLTGLGLAGSGYSGHVDHERHAAYLQSWLTILKSDKKAIFQASTQAQKAADWILKDCGVLVDTKEEAA